MQVWTRGRHAATLALALAIVGAGLPAQAAGDEVVEGELVTVVSEDAPDDLGVPTEEYAVVGHEGDLVPVDDALAEDAPVGALVRVDVAADGSADDLEVLAAEPLAAAAAAGARAVTIVIMPIKNHPVAPANEATARAAVTGADAYWDRNLGGRVRFSVSKVQTVAAQPASLCTASPYQVWDVAAQASGFSYGAGKHLVVVMPDGCGSYGVATVGNSMGSGGYVQVNRAGADVLAHELGHNISLAHANLLQCNAGIVDVKPGQKGCEIYTYGDPHDVQGFGGRASIGSLSSTWLDWFGLRTGPTFGQNTNETVTLVPPRGSGTTSARVLDPVTGEYYYVEYRTNTGDDQGNAWPSWNTRGGITYAASHGVRILRFDRGAKGGVPDSILIPAPGGTNRRTTSWAPGQTFTSPSGGVIISVVSASSSSATVSIRVAMGFTDVAAANPFHDHIAWLAETGITTGYPDGSFHPNEAVSRQAMAAFLYRTAGSPAFTAPQRATFADVPRTHPFFKEVEWLAARGISTGSAGPNGTLLFAPGQSVTREAMAAFLHRLGGSGAVAPDAPTFRDVRTDNKFYDDIRWLAAEGISTGWDDGTFRPSESVTRQAMAAFLYRFVTG